MLEIEIMQSVCMFAEIHCSVDIDLHDLSKTEVPFGNILYFQHFAVTLSSYLLSNGDNDLKFSRSSVLCSMKVKVDVTMHHSMGYF